MQVPRKAIKQVILCGNGVYKSTDVGKSWQHLGSCRDSHHIGRMWVDPKNPARLMVAALGHLYSKQWKRYRSLPMMRAKTGKQVDDYRWFTRVADMIATPEKTLLLFFLAQAKVSLNFGGEITICHLQITDGEKHGDDISKAESGFPRSQYTAGLE